MDFSECYPDTVSRVAAAARSGSRRRLRRLILDGCSLDCRDNRGWTPLHEAVAAGHARCAQDILSTFKGSVRRDYVNARTHEGETACFLAALVGQVSLLKLLLKARADINQQTNDGSCPLFTAVDNGYVDVVKLLIQNGAEVNGTHTESRWTCLHQAVYKGHSDIVRLLVNVCNLEAPDDWKITPVFVAAQYGRQECLQILISAGADVNVQVADLATPLLISSQEGHKDCVELLLQHGADPNINCSPSSPPPHYAIHAAAEFGHVQILRRLIPVTDRKCSCDEDEVSPLYVAIYAGQSQSVEVLLQGGFSPDAQQFPSGSESESPLNYALSESTKITTQRNCYSECVRLLVAAGATIREQSWMYALGTDEMDILQLVLQHRYIPPPQTLTDDSSPSPPHLGKMALKLQEVREMICVALSQVRFAACWLPLLLNAGLEPSLLLQCCMLEKADSEALNYLLAFVNWSTLSAPLKQILDQRLEAKTWEPCPEFENIPQLSHLCRLQIRTILGPDQLLRTEVVRQLPLPPQLQDFLQFTDVPESSYTTELRPTSPFLDRLMEFNTSHQQNHIHVL